MIDFTQPYPNEVNDPMNATRDANVRLAAKALEYIREGVIITDSESRIVSVNPAFTRMSGYRPEEAVGHKPNLLQSGRHGADFYRGMWRKLLEEGYWEGEIWNRKKSGEAFLEWINISAIKDEDGEVTNYVAVFSDITERKLAEQRLERRAYYDHLTGLPNRLRFQDRLREGLAEPFGPDGTGAVLFVDLDGFKSWNDRHGHAAGDRLLRAAAHRLRDVANGEGEVYRYGGDEFTVWIGKGTDRSGIERLAESILEGFKEPFVFDGTEMRLSASIGVRTIGDGETRDPEVLLRNADQAMYQAKRLGGGRHYFFPPAGSDPAEERRERELQLRQALERGEFLLRYQPRLELRTGRLAGMEALIRWNRPDQGLVAPGEFIPFAEETGLIVPIGEWALREACDQLDRWRRAGYVPVPVSVNLSPLQFQQSTLPRRVRQLLSERGLSPSLLELEVTESSVAPRIEEAVAILGELKEIGVGLSIDDFGTGYSSLGHLARFPVDTLKIDKSFVRSIEDGRRSSQIVTAIVKMAHGMDLGVVAEGVETGEQRRFLDKLGCEWGQGFHFCPPVPPEEIAARYWGRP